MGIGARRTAMSTKASPMIASRRGPTAPARASPGAGAAVGIGTAQHTAATPAAAATEAAVAVHSIMCLAPARQRTHARISRARAVPTQVVGAVGQRGLAGDFGGRGKR